MNSYFVFDRYSDFDEITLEKAIQGGAKSVDYTKVVEWLTKELQYLLSLDEHVMATSSPDDSSAFQMELSSFLKEIGKFFREGITPYWRIFFKNINL